jgi:hypothetical protein
MFVSLILLFPGGRVISRGQRLAGSLPISHPRSPLPRYERPWSSTEADIWVFGMILYEIMTGEKPYGNKPDPTVQRLMVENVEPPLSPGDTLLHDIYINCVSYNPSEPPEFCQTDSPRSSTVRTRSPSRTTATACLVLLCSHRKRKRSSPERRGHASKCLARRRRSLSVHSMDQSHAFTSCLCWEQISPKPMTILASL